MTAPTLYFYDDSALTTLSTTPLAFTQDDLGGIAPHQRRFYLGNAEAGWIFEAASDPGVDQITLSINDGAGQPASAIKLATTQANLATAVGGDPLDLGVTILSGAVNAVQVWVEFDDSTGVVAAVDTTVSLSLNSLSVSGS